MRLAAMNIAVILALVLSSCEGGRPWGVDPVAPVLASFRATPEVVVAGEATQLAWSFSFVRMPFPAPTCVVDQGVGNVSNGQETSASLGAATTFTLTCTNDEGSDTATTTVGVTPVPRPAAIEAFTASPSTIMEGRPTRVTWAWRYANTPAPEPRCTVDQGIGTVVSGQEMTLTLAREKTYTLTCANSAGSGSATTTISVTPKPVPPVMDSFTASPATVVEGAPTTVIFSWTYAATPVPEPACTIDHGVGPLASGAETSLTLAVDTTFTVTCTNEAGAEAATTTVTVVPAPVAPAIASFAASPASVEAGAPTNVTWRWTYANAPSPAPVCAIDGGVGTLASGTTTSVTLLADTTYTLSCTNAGGSGTATAVVTVTALPVAPVIASFTAAPSTVVAGVPTSVTWTWSYANAPTPAPACAIDGGVGTLTSGTTTSLTLLADTTYTLTCTNAGGSGTATAVVTVTALPVAPVIASFTAAPSSVVEGTPTNVTWTWSYANAPTPAPACAIDGGVGTLASGTTTSLTLLADTTYTLSCTNAAGTGAATAVVSVTPLEVAPVIATFQASPASVIEGLPTTVTWSWAYSGTPWPGPSCVIDNGVGPVTNGSSTVVTQAVGTIYTLVCSNSAGSDSAQAVVTTTPPSPGSLSCPPVVNADMASCPSYLGANVVTLNVGGTLDQAVLSCNPGTHLDRTYCWTAPSMGTFRFSLANTTGGTSLAFALFRADTTCAELACDNRGSAGQIDVALWPGEKVYIVLEERTGNDRFTLSITKL